MEPVVVATAAAAADLPAAADPAPPVKRRKRTTAPAPTPPAAAGGKEEDAPASTRDSKRAATLFVCRDFETPVLVVAVDAKQARAEVQRLGPKLDYDYMEEMVPEVSAVTHTDSLLQMLGNTHYVFRPVE